jgi:MEMO1 family protein
MTMLIGGPILPLRRDLDMAPVQQDGETLFLLSDAAGLEDKSFVVSLPVVLVASLFDGRRRARDVSLELAKQNVTLAEAEIQSVADQLEKAGLLETEAVEEGRRRALESFRASSVRPVRVQARGLPEDPLALGAFLNRFYADAKGPGRSPGAAEAACPLGVVSPHIDFFRGGPAYAWAYLSLAEAAPPDVIVAVGVAHRSPPSPWVMTRKSYETPFGPLAVDEGLYDEVRSALWYDPTDDEWVHAKEHSLEFQALWLKHLWRDKTPAWVPILCSAFDAFCPDRPPSSVETVEGALRRVGEALRRRREKGQKILILAGVDLAHVGRRFGDETDVTPELEQRVERLDRASLEKALRLDADGFFLDGVGENAWRKVCGLSALYTALRWIKESSPSAAAPAGKLLAYDKAPDPAGGIVSFASAVYS